MTRISDTRAQPGGALNASAPGSPYLTDRIGLHVCTNCKAACRFVPLGGTSLDTKSYLVQHIDVRYDAEKDHASQSRNRTLICSETQTCAQTLQIGAMLPLHQLGLSDDQWLDVGCGLCSDPDFVKIGLAPPLALSRGYRQQFEPEKFPCEASVPSVG